MTRIATATLCVLVLATAGPAAASEPYPGIVHTAFDGDFEGRPQRYHVVEIDLTDPAITMRMSNEYLATERMTSEIAIAEDAEIAVNGNYSDGTFLHGYAISDGVEYTSMNQSYNSNAIGWNADDEWALFDAAYPSMIPAGLEQAVSGCGFVVRDGVACDGSPGGCPLPGCTNDGHRGPNPRTMIGVDQGRTTAWLVTVDGRQEGATGFSLQQCATFMQGLGAWDAVNLDGGGSTAMYIENEGGLVNSPSNDQPERPVPNAVLVHVAVEGDESSGSSGGDASESGEEESVSAGDDPGAGAATAPTTNRGGEEGCACRTSSGSGVLGFGWLLIGFAIARRASRARRPRVFTSMTR